jgi:C-terminal processing protease CtpA/Prc
MNQILLTIVSFLSLTSCNSIKQNNEHLNDLIAVNDLKSDVDFVYKKMKQLHPKLYWYISEKELDYKFDSLKITITQPMTSFDFYKKLSPVVAAVREGHMQLIPKVKLLSKTETALLSKKGVGPFSQFNLEVFNDKLYVVKNKSYDKSIKTGTEIVAINGNKSQDLMKECKSYFASDGFNTTLKNNVLSKKVPNFFTNQFGMKDSIAYDFKRNDTLKTVWIKRKVIDPLDLKKKKTVFSKAEKKALQEKKNTGGYDNASKIFSRSLKFIEKDSSVAVIKINSFTKGDYEKFYKKSFQKIKDLQSKTVVIDIRNNGGGNLAEISNLYKYLSDTSFVFLDKSQVTMRTSLLHADFFKGGNLGAKVFKTLYSPFYYGYQYFSVHKESDGKFYSNTQTKLQKIDKNAFKGKVYLLINGGSFSASSILASNLKGSKRAIVVGEETGGAYNGTVAGFMPVLKLPKSENKIRIGLMTITPHYKTNIEGRGVFPDKEIIPTLEDRIKGNDPEMNWILEDLKKNPFKALM